MAIFFCEVRLGMGFCENRELTPVHFASLVIDKYGKQWQSSAKDPKRI